MLEILNKIQCELKAPKGQMNRHGGYAYRSCEDILEAVKPLLQKYEVAITISDEIVLLGDRFYVKATATLRGKDGEISVNAFARETEAKISKGGGEILDRAQITGAASSYARKYALNGLFAIDDTRDADATNDHGAGAANNKSGEYPVPMSEEQVADLLQLCEASGTDPRKVAAAYKTSDIAFVPFEKVRAQLLQKLAKAQEARKGA